MRGLLAGGGILFWSLHAVQSAHPQSFDPNAEPAIELAQTARSCKQASSCEEAVRMWCDGYRRADGDNDGIPCENVCHSLEQVEQVKAQIGC
jgi:hypothetical protein